MTAHTSGMFTFAGRRIDGAFLLILAVALGLRVYFAAHLPYIHDEDNNAIALARTISFTPGSIHLPLRGENHGALPAYVVKASGSLFGTTEIGYRALHILLGLLTIALVYPMTGQWFGPVAARWAAALIAFNEYFLHVTSRATAHAPFHFLIALAVYCFSRFLALQRPGYLYGAAASVGLAFYCKETAVLLLPVFFLTFLHARLRHWLFTPQVYVAVVIVAAILSVDVYWNATVPETVTVSYGDQVEPQAHYSSHLSRIRGLAFSPYPLMFYGRSAVMAAYRAIPGVGLNDNTAEYPSMNPALGALLLGCVVAATASARRQELLGLFLLVLFWLIFGLFSMIEPGDPPGRLDSVSWIWVELTLAAAVMVTAERLARVRGWAKGVVWTFTGVALGYSVVQIFLYMRNELA